MGEHHGETRRASSSRERSGGRCRGRSSTSEKAGGARPRTKKKQPKKVSRPDPDAALVTMRRNFHLEPSYKQHTAVDDQEGVIVDVEVITGEENEGKRLIEAIDRIEETTGKDLQEVTADASYAHGLNYQELERRGG